MWMQPWKLKEGFAIGLGLVLTGLMLQWSVGPVQWKLFAFPLNLLALVFLLLIIGVVYALRSKVYAFRFLSTYAAAVPALCWAVFLTAIMGITRQVPTGHAPVDVLGFTDMLSSWPFVLVYFWLVIQLGELIVDRLFRFTWRDTPFYLNHLGLFIVMVSATLGSADMQRLKLNINMETPEWRAVDDQGKVHELALAIQLKRFRIDEYPPETHAHQHEDRSRNTRTKALHFACRQHFQRGRHLKVAFPHIETHQMGCAGHDPRHDQLRLLAFVRCLLRPSCKSYQTPDRQQGACSNPPPARMGHMWQLSVSLSGAETRRQSNARYAGARTRTLYLPRGNTHQKRQTHHDRYPCEPTF